MSERIEKLAAGGIVTGPASFESMDLNATPLDTAAMRPPQPPVLPPMQIAVSPAERAHLEARLQEYVNAPLVAPLLRDAEQEARRDAVRAPFVEPFRIRF